MNTVRYFNELSHPIFRSEGNCCLRKLGEMSSAASGETASPSATLATAVLSWNMRNAEKSTCSAVGNPFEFFLDARTSKSISNFASRERIGKPAFLITRMAQSRRENINFLPAKSLVRPRSWHAVVRRDQDRPYKRSVFIERNDASI